MLNGAFTGYIQEGGSKKSALNSKNVPPPIRLSRVTQTTRQRITFGVKSGSLYAYFM